MTETMTKPDGVRSSDQATDADAKPALDCQTPAVPSADGGQQTALDWQTQAALLPLRRNKPFQTLWAGSAASALGISVADVAYPLAILGVTRSPADAGLFAAMQTVGQILSGLPAGQLVDHRSPRMLLIVAETGRALVTGLVALALIMGWLTLPLLLIAAVLLGAGQPVVSAARLLMIRTVVPKEQLTRAMTQDEVRVNGSELAGPPIGGALYGLNVLAHAVPFLFTIGSFLMSLIAAIVVKVEPDRSPVAPGQAAAKESDQPKAVKDDGMLAGIKSIWTSPILRVTTMLLAAINCLGAGLSLITVVILRDQGISSTQIGLALGTSAIGGLLGAALVRPLHRLRPGALMILVASLLVPLIALLAVPFGPWWVAGLLFIAMLGVPSVRVLVDVLILRQAPPAERGRVVAAVMTLLSIGMPGRPRPQRPAAAVPAGPDRRADPGRVARRGGAGRRDQARGLEGPLAASKPSHLKRDPADHGGVLVFAASARCHHATPDLERGLNVRPAGVAVRQHPHPGPAHADDQPLGRQPVLPLKGTPPRARHVHEHDVGRHRSRVNRARQQLSHSAGQRSAHAHDLRPAASAPPQERQAQPPP